MTDRLGCRPVPVLIPWGSESAFAGVFDVIAQVGLRFGGEAGEDVDRGDEFDGWSAVALLKLAVGGVGRTEVGDRSRHDDDVSIRSFQVAGGGQVGLV